MLSDTLLDLLELARRHEIGLVQHDEVGGVDLVDDDGGFLLGGEQVRRVDHGDDGVETEPGVADLLCEGIRVRETGGLDDEEVRIDRFDDRPDGHAELVVHGAADAAVVELDHLFDVHALDGAAVDADVADLVDDDGDLLVAHSARQHLLEQRGLTAAQESGDDVDGQS